MRKLLLLALLLYDIIASANRYSYDYNDIISSKRNSFDERRNWRKKVLQKPYESEQNDWEDRRRYENYNLKYADNVDVRDYSGKERHRQHDVGLNYKDNRRYDDQYKMKHLPNVRSSELEHAVLDLEKPIQKKTSPTLNCQRQHERFESCFAGCAAISCDNPRERLQPCYPFCEAGCVCLPPYVRDDRTHKCVLPEDCSKGLKGIPDLGEDV